MAISTLSGSYIDETYGRLVQTNGSEFADGLGNPISFGAGNAAGPIDSIQINRDGSNFTGSANLKFVNNNIQLTGSILMSGSSYIAGVDYIDFDTTTPAPAQSEGRLFWNADSKTLQLDLEQNFHTDLNQQMLVRVVNKTGADIPIGHVVFISGSQGNRPGIKLASYESDSTSAATVGFTAKAINNNNNGYVITRGILDGLNTSAFAVGDRLFLSSSGDFTNIAPDAPLHEVRLGKVIVSDATNGSIYVDIMNGYELDELHDVKATNPNYGDLFMYSGSLWTATKTLSGSYVLSGSLTTNDGVMVNTLTASAISASSIVGYVAASETSSMTVLSSSYANSADNTNTIDIYSFGYDVDSYPLFSNTIGRTGVAIGGDTDLTYNAFTNKLTVGNISATSITASVFGYVENIQTGSFVTNSQTGSMTMQNLTVTGTASIQYLTVIYETASVIYSSGSNQLGDATNDTQTLIGTVIVSGSQRITGSLNISGSGLTVTGSLNATNITGSLRGTASWANNAVVANSATNATNATNVGITPITTGTGPYYLTFAAGTVGNNPLLVDSDGITYNATTNTLATTASWSTRPIAVTGSTIYSTSPSSITSFNSNNTNSNIFLGNNAGINSITASSCVAIGNTAGSGLRNVNGSVFIGSSAGVNAYYVDKSIMIGIGAGQNATNASESVFLGDFAGAYAANASYSTLIGYKAGSILASGGSRSSIGPNNIIIGTNIGLDLNRRDSINIGGIIFGTGSYSTITEFEFDAYTGSADGRIGIGVVNPTTKLQVNGTISATSKTNIGTFDVSGVHLSYDVDNYGYLQAVFNDGGAGQYRPLFIDASLIGLNGDFIRMPNLIAATQTNIIGIDGNGYLYTQPATTIIAATVDEITFGSGSNTVEPENLEQSKYTTVNIFNYLNFS